MAQNVVKTLSGRSFFDQTVYDNVLLSSVLAIDEFLCNEIFPDDGSRLVYAKNEFAFRRRLQTQGGNENSEFQTNTLNFPFMNYAIQSSGVSRNTDRTIKSHPLEVLGFYVPKLGRRLRATPLQIKFESTFFSTEESDIDYALSKFQWCMTEEYLLQPTITIEGVDFANFGSLTFDGTDYNANYDESDFLKENRIKTVGVNMTLDTYLPNFHGNTRDEVTIPKTVLLSFVSRHNLTDWDWSYYDELYTGTIDHDNETVTWEKTK